jgi:UDP-N-acetyl-2-amino-2-deoxyglucuronate dehydrogenase
VERIRTSIVGCGKVAALHAAALASLPESEFVGVCSRSSARARDLGARFGVRAFGDLGEMIDSTRPEALLVCTPHPEHAAVAVPAIEAGLHILVEKPLASSLADCDAILDAARTAGVQVGTVSQRRFYEPCARIRKAIDDGKIGRPILGSVSMFGWRDEPYYRSDPWRGTWSGEGGGVLVNQAPHQLDLLLWYMGPAVELCGYWGNLNHPYIEVEDTAVAVVRFANAGLAHIAVSNSQNPALYGRVQVHGSNGASIGVQTDGGAMFVAGMSPITEPPLNDLWTIRGEERLLAEWRELDTRFFHGINPMEHYHRLQIEDFLRSLLRGTAPAVTGADGRRTVELFTAIYRSQRDSAPVRFPLPPETGRADFDGRSATVTP